MLCIDESCTGYGRVMSKCKVSTEFLVSRTWASRLLSHETLHPPRHPVTAVVAQVSDKGSCFRDGHRLGALLCKKVSCDKYFLLLHRMQLPCIGWLVSLNSRDDSRGENIWLQSKTQRHARPSFHWSVRCFVYSKPKSNLCSALTS